MTWHVTWLDICHFYPRYPSSQCSVSGLKWRVVWSLILWKTGGSPLTLSSSTAGQLYSVKFSLFQCGIYHFILGPDCVLSVHNSFFLLVLKVALCFHMQHFWSRPWWCDQSVHYHLIAAPRGRGRCRWSRHRPGRDAASVSCRCTGASVAGHPNVAQHQWAHRQSLRCHIKGLHMGRRIFHLHEDSVLMGFSALFHDWNFW